MELHNLKPGAPKKSRKRLGRGSGSGLGTSSGKGTKGQKARSGGGIRPGFEGGQMPLYRRLPKRGFNNYRFATVFEIVNLDVLEERFAAGETVNAETLIAKGLIKGNKDGVKVLGNGELTKKLVLEVNKISASAQEKVEKAGGSVTVL